MSLGAEAGGRMSASLVFVAEASVDMAFQLRPSFYLLPHESSQFAPHPPPRPVQTQHLAQLCPARGAL